MSTQTSTSASTAPNPLLILFARGVIARLSFWPTLKLAVTESWGGPESAQKRTWMASVIVDEFDPAQSPETPDDIYLEDMMLQIMSDEFEVTLEDGSAEAVAKDIVMLWHDLKEHGTSTTVGTWEERARRTMGEKVQVERTVDETGETEGAWTDEDEEDEETHEAPQLIATSRPKRREEPEVDDEGFTLVKGKGKRHG